MFKDVCPNCGKKIVRVDYPDDGDFYHVEDTEWGIEPNSEDPGFLVAKENTYPASICGNNP